MEEDPLPSNEAATSSTGPTLYIQTLPTSDRYFWKSDLEQQFSQTVFDLEVPQQVRLTGNILLTMALNEIAVQRNRGFFFHLPHRRAYRSFAKTNMEPESRRTTPPGAEFPSCLYVPFVWSAQNATAFRHESHRGRYLKCNALINPPKEPCPIYPMQVITSSDAPIYSTQQKSLVIFTTQSALYLASTAELEETPGGWPSKQLPKGPDPKRRLSKIPHLWDKTDHESHEDFIVMQPYRVRDLVSLYDEIVKRCESSGVPSTTVSAIDQHIPRPAASEPGDPLGTTVPTSASIRKSATPTRRGEKKQKRKREGTS